MSLFDIILIQPIFNVLVFIYGIIPGHDFGVALILFTVLVRLAMWPLVKKQLRQTKAMQKIQPELKKIKQRAKGNKQLEAQLMMDLYKEKNVNPFSSIGLLILQIPIFIALFAVINHITQDSANIAKYTYGFMQNIGYIKDLIANPDMFSEHLFGVVDLTKTAMGASGTYWPLIIMAIVAAGLQFWQSKQLLPKVESDRKLKDILKEQATGKDVDQSEISALISNRMVILFPIMTLFIGLYLAGALVLYLLVTSAMAVIQQTIILRQDTDELETIASKKPSKAAQQKVKQAKEAQVVSQPAAKKTKRRK